MAAATEWLNALAAGAEVVSVRRREPARRPLNVPRPLFSKAGLASFHAAGRAQKVELLAQLRRAVLPAGSRVGRAGRVGDGAKGGSGVSGSVDGEAQVICATGFLRGFEHDDLLRGLVEEHGLDTEERWIVLAPDGTVPALTDATRTLALRASRPSGRIRPRTRSSA